MFKFNKKTLLFSIVAFMLLATVVNAATSLETGDAFRKYKSVKNINILVPTVVEVPIENFYLERLDFMVVDQSTGLFLPYYYKKDIRINDISYSATTIPTLRTAYRMTDRSSKTYTEFDLDKNDQGTVTINLKSTAPVVSSAIMALLDKNIALPTSAEVSAIVNGRSKKLLAKTHMSQQTIRFPRTTAKEWKVVFTYAQPLRINEMRLVQENPGQSSSQSLRFLAQPDREYKIYFDPDRYVKAPTSEAGNLYSNEGIVFLSTLPSVANPFYTQSDLDKDGTPDIHDNCVSVANKDQKDIDGNDRGDVCDDFDRDGIMNDKDNCINDPNRNQSDEDGDKIGDVCDEEESRLTEKHKWIPWLGIGFALVVIIVLFIITATSKEPLIQRDEEEVHDDDIE